MQLVLVRPWPHPCAHLQGKPPSSLSCAVLRDSDWRLLWARGCRAGLIQTQTGRSHTQKALPKLRSAVGYGNPAVELLGAALRQAVPRDGQLDSSPAGVLLTPAEALCSVAAAFPDEVRQAVMDLRRDTLLLHGRSTGGGRPGKEPGRSAGAGGSGAGDGGLSGEVLPVPLVQRQAAALEGPRGRAVDGGGGGGARGVWCSCCSCGALGVCRAKSTGSSSSRSRVTAARRRRRRAGCSCTARR